jgi:prophage antirepressor-like protein
MNMVPATFTFAPAAGSTVRVRMVRIDGQLWFVAADVASMLGFDTTAGAGWHTRHLHPDERNTITLTEGRRGNPNKTVISESGLYKLILRSDKLEARIFDRWVRHEVLPAIRKDGAYFMGEEKVRAGEMSEDELILRAAEILKKKVARLAEEKAELRRLSGHATRRLREGR